MDKMGVLGEIEKALAFKSLHHQKCPAIQHAKSCVDITSLAI